VQVKLPASKWLARQRSVEQMIWTPAEELIIRHRLLIEGGWIERPGSHCFNLYRPPAVIRGNARYADVWIDHGRKLYPDDFDEMSISRLSIARARARERQVFRARAESPNAAGGTSRLTDPLLKSKNYSRKLCG
jgi:hypothetical protein